MFIKSWSSRPIRTESLNRALLDHEHRMVGSRLYSERYIKERDFIEYENVAIADNGSLSFNGETTLATNHIERREVKKWRYFLMEKTWEHKWNRYKGENDNKLIMDMVVKELSQREYQAYKKANNFIN